MVVSIAGRKPYRVLTVIRKSASVKIMSIYDCLLEFNFAINPLLQGLPSVLLYHSVAEGIVQSGTSLEYTQD